MTIPTEYQTDHLLLLVGENPLPNYVAAKVLLKPGGVVHLVHSDETYRIAERLCKHLNGKVQLMRVDPTDATDIADNVRARLRSLQGTVGLHYTGGTKSMAVHAYRAVEAKLKPAVTDAVFSYLDAATFELRIDPDWHETVLFAVKPKLEDLAALHGAHLRKGSPQREADLWGVCTATMLARGGWQKRLPTFLHNLRAQALKPSPQAVDLPQDPRYKDICQALCQDLGLPPEATVIPPKVVASLKSKEKWFGGEWLEHYVLAQMLKIAPEARVHDCGMSLEMDQSKSRGADFDFEFDVAAIRGYQFFGISCTVSDNKDTAKQKLFEAYIRARQLGGAEARVGLVCAYDDVYRFEHEVVQEWLAKGKIKVFGPRDWPRMDELLMTWLRSAQ